MTLVALFRENQYRQDLTFERLIQCAKGEVDSFRTMAPRLGTTRPSADKPKRLEGILRVTRATSRSPPPNEQVAFLHEATTPVGSIKSAYGGASDQPEDGEEAFVVE